MEGKRRGLRGIIGRGGVRTRRTREVASRTEEATRIRRPLTSLEQAEDEERRLEGVAQVKNLNPFSYAKLAEIKKIRASILTRDQVRLLGLVEITKNEEPNPSDLDSLIGSVYDQKMGPSSYSKRCTTCDIAKCPGHLGYIDFGESPNQSTGIYVPPFLLPYSAYTVRGMLNLFCHGCGEPVFNEGDIIRLGLTRSTTTRRVKILEEHFKSQRKGRLYCPLKAAGVDISRGYQAELVKPELCGQIRELSYNREWNTIVDSGGNELSTTLIKESLLRISPTTEKLFGFRYNRPADFLTNFVTVLPPRLRETGIIGNEEKRKDHLGKEYQGIIRRKKALHIARQAFQTDPTVKNKAATEDIISEIHITILRIFSSGAGPKKFQRAGADVKGIKEEMAGKEGHIRHITMGKRIDRSIRAPISPNPLLRFGYCQLTKITMEEQFTDMYVTPWNREALLKLLANGVVKFYAPKKEYYKRNRYMITDKNRSKTQLWVGDVVALPLQESDRLNLGRNPTIHKLGIMNMRIAVPTPGMISDENTIRLHPSYTTPYNGDFDGDEMHGSFPQELLSRAEGRFLMDVILNIMNSESSSASMGIVMDGIIEIGIGTSPYHNGYFTVSEDELETLYSLMTWKKELEGGSLDARLKTHGISKFSTRGIISATFPATFNCNIEAKDKSRLIIRDGILISGFVTKGNVGPARNSLIQDIYFNYSPFRAAYFITDLFRLANYLITYIRGFTVGVKDIAEKDPMIRATAVPSLRKTYDTIYTIDRPTPDPLEAERREYEIIGHLKSGAQALGDKITRKALGGPNGFGNMARTGAKGDTFHLQQMTASGAGMGQNFWLGGRLPREMTDYTRADHYSIVNDTDPEARGYVPETLAEGISLRSTISHHKATRATLIDTTTKTADAGDTHHLENKALQDLKVDYYNSLVDANGMIVQFMAGEIGLDPMHITRIKIADDRNVEFFVDIDQLYEEAVSAVLLGLDEDPAYLFAPPVGIMA